MMPTMTREKFEALSFEELMEWAYENCYDIHTEESLIAFAKRKIDDENLQMAIHILSAIYESTCPDDSYFRYDYTMGTLETPIPITCKEDIEDLIDFIDEEIDIDVSDCINWEAIDNCDDPEVDEEYLAYYKKEGED